jgi:hypothetical protein
MTIPENNILATQVLTTVMDGKPVYGDIWYVLFLMAA